MHTKLKSEPFQPGLRSGACRRGGGRRVFHSCRSLPQSQVLK